jgi:hypothetical protein
VTTTTYREIASLGWSALVEALRPQVRRARSLEEAAQGVAQAIWEALPESTVLVRLYAVAAREDLPGDVRQFVDDLAAGAGQEELISAATPVLALVGTYGAEDAWQDRKKSRGHRGIPLVSASFVDAIPMLARLLKELGIELSWLDDAPAALTEKLVGGFNGIFYVEDARTIRDRAGRLVIPETDFVEREGVRTVFGMGGFYPDGTMLVCIVFTRELLTRTVVETLSSLITMLKAETFGSVLAERVFARKSDAQRSKQ